PAPVHGAEPPVFVPTGLYVQSVEFSGPYTVEVSGQIWQRYANDLPKDLTEGVFLPEAKEQPTFKEVYSDCHLGDLSKSERRLTIRITCGSCRRQRLRTE